MERKYLKAIYSGVFGLFLLFILFIAMVFIIDSMGQNEPPGSDSGPAAVGAAMIFVAASLVSMVLVGGLSAWWALKKTISPKEAVVVSSIAGAIPTCALCLIIFTFDMIVNYYGPSLENFISNLLSSGLTGCCIGVFVIGIGLSVAGGLLYETIIFLLYGDYKIPMG